MAAVTYGPFPGGWPDSFESDFARIAASGMNAVRLFEMPDRDLLDAAWKFGLRVFGGLQWGQHADFMWRPELYTSAQVALARSLAEVAGHPALAGVYVGNEVPSDLVRWMGPLEVRRSIEQLITCGREVAPDLMFAYANYPSTEYLEPANADFSAFNIYLEEAGPYRKYLRRLHHIAGDRPLVISEFGMDSRRNGPERQAEVLGWGLGISLEEETAGFTVYAWSDRWWNNGAEVLDWDFGLTDREGRDKPALAAVSRAMDAAAEPVACETKFSVIICTRNGRTRIGRCLAAVRKLVGENIETIVVDDGSTDGTADYVVGNFPWLQLVRLDPVGLSAARNAGAAAASGDVFAFTDDDCEPDPEWILRLRRIFGDGRFAAAGGPNLPPEPRFWEEAVVSAAPGAPSHVMLDDEEAEHLPGCNLAVTREAFEAIDGFDVRFHTAGDDVDFCWRLREADFRLGFAPGAFVWHWRRPYIRSFLRQQLGYGNAERMLICKHPENFSKHGGAKWRGFVYGGGPVRVMADSIIYHGPMGNAGYQAVTNRMLPLRGLDERFDDWRSRLSLRAVRWLVPRFRAWARNRTVFWRSDRLEEEGVRILTMARSYGDGEFVVGGDGALTREELQQRLLGEGWAVGGPTDDWDAEKHGTYVLMATEYGEAGSRHTLVRVWGDLSLLPFGRWR